MRRYGIFHPQACALGHSEAVLLIDHHVAKILELHRIFNHGVGAYEHVERAVEKLLVNGTAFGCRGGAGEELDIYPYRGHKLAQGLGVLCGKDFCGSHQACLCAVAYGYEHGHQCHERLSAAHIALEQAVHLPA